MYVILVYDISFDDGGKKILPKVFKVCKKYLTHIQKSTFEGEISDSQLLKLKMELGKYVRKDVDSVIVFQSRNVRWLDKEFWGVVDEKTSRFI